MASSNDRHNELRAIFIDNGSKWFNFVKEWSGLAVLIIAILQFPFSFLKNLSEYRDAELVQTRDSLSQIADLTAQKILAENQIKLDETSEGKADAATSAKRSVARHKIEIVSNSFKARISNIIVRDEAAYISASKRLDSSELNQIASNYTLTDAQIDAIPFYERVIKKEKISDCLSRPIVNWAIHI